MTTPQLGCFTSESPRPVIDQLLAARNRLRRAASAGKVSPLVGADLYWALGTLTQCSAAVNEVIEQVGLTIGRRLGDGTSVAEAGPLAGAPDAALLRAVLELATASARFEAVAAALTAAQIAVTDLAASPARR